MENTVELTSAEGLLLEEIVSLLNFELNLMLNRVPPSKSDALREYLSKNASEYINKTPDAESFSFYSSDLSKEYSLLKEAFRGKMALMSEHLAEDVFPALYSDDGMGASFNAIEELVEPMDSHPFTPKLEEFLKRNEAKLPRTARLYELLKGSGVMAKEVESYERLTGIGGYF